MIISGDVAIFCDWFDIIYGKVILHFSGFSLFSSRLLTGEIRIADSFDTAAFRMRFFRNAVILNESRNRQSGQWITAKKIDEVIENLLSYF